MSKVIRLEVTDEVAASLETLHAALRQSSPDMTLPQLVATVIQHGCERLRSRLGPCPYPADDTPLGQVTFRQLASMLGVTDIDARRDAERAALAQQQECQQVVGGLLASVKELSTTVVVKLDTQERVEQHANQLRHVLRDHPGHHAVVVCGIVNSTTGATAPIPTELN